MPRVSVIVPVFGAARTLRTALESIAASEYPDVEIICADDGSTDGSRDLLGVAGEVRTVRIDHAGPAAARNRAVREASGEILFFTDADVEIFPDTIAAGIRHFVADPELSALFGSYTPEPGSGDFLTRYKNYVHHFTHQTARPDAFTFWTGCGFVRREAFDALGGFDEAQRFLSDVEFGYRLHLAGHRVRIDRRIQVVHHKVYTWRSLLRSDLMGRAIPWSRLIMRHRTVRGDLNLKLNNVLSVPLSCLLLLTPLAALVVGWAWVAVLLAGFALLWALNAEFLGWVRRRSGVPFALGTLGVQWIVYVVSAVGVVLATLGARSGGR
jgi:glycosyltransferase involved in cell wall biosynthesis